MKDCCDMPMNNSGHQIRKHPYLDTTPGCHQKPHEGTVYQHWCLSQNTNRILHCFFSLNNSSYVEINWHNQAHVLLNQAGRVSSFF
jgi:hypothetical protein